MAQSFERLVADFARRAPEQADRIAKTAVIQLWNAVITSTPVGNPDLWKSEPPAGYVGGRLRGNWFASIGNPSDRETDSPSRKSSAASSAARVVSSARTGDVTYWLTNNLPYARRVEEGSSTQAPSGMVRVNTQRFQRILSRAARVR